MRADNTRHLVQAARHRAQQTRRNAVAALRRLDNTGQPINFDSVAREAGVSRSWLYAQADLRSEIERLRERRQPTVKPGLPRRQRASDPSLLHRLEAAAERIRQLERDNHELRDALARALGEQRTSAIIGTTRRRDTPDKTRAKLIGPC
jgi:hypothetical protein